MKKKGLGKFIAGIAVGAGLGVLFAPKSGEETRKELKTKIDELIEKAKEVDMNEVRDNIEKKIADIKKELSELDKEKVMSIAKEQARHIQSKCNDLVKYAKEKGTPVLEKAAQGVKDKTIEVLENTLEKIKGSENTKKAK